MIYNSYRSLLSVLLLAIFIPFSSISAQIITISPGTNSLSIIENDLSALSVSNTISEIHANKVKANDVDFIHLNIEGYGFTTTVGHPQLPLLTKLIEVPFEAGFEVEVVSSKFIDISLTELGFDDYIFPAQPSRVKSDQTELLQFYFNQDIYNTNAFLINDLVQVEHIGILRGVDIARMIVLPVNYNPVANILRVYDHIELRIRFINGSEERTVEMKQMMNPFFAGIKKMLLNYQEPVKDNLFQNNTITYIIVSDPMFKVALQPLISWKSRKGFNVVDVYTDNPEVGNTALSIKNYLKGFYENPPEGFQPQSYVLLVGDVTQIPAFNGTTGSHVTDLYYCEYTGDYLPEAFYGRFSANNLSQLQPQIDKTLEYEQYLFPDPTFLDEVVMVAGHDSYHQLTWGNGQVNYGNTYYFNQQNGIFSHTYLQPEPAGENYSISIRQNISNGVAFANYSAHCSASGWTDPSFTVNHIQSLQNQSKYAFMIGNCCSSVDFQNNSFGEEILRATGKGAIGYVGGSANTYWDEDFWWAVGFKSISANPVFANTSLGAFDRIIHSQPGIAINDWHTTQGEAPMAGNLAVTQSGSNLSHYYWEIYHLMGDPSLSVFYSQPSDIWANYPAIIPFGETTFNINTLPFTYVAVSINNSLLGASFTDEKGNSEINLQEPSAPGEAEIIITGQQLKPFFGNLLIASPEGPYVLVKKTEINDWTLGNGNGQLDYDESFSLNITLQNHGQKSGENIQLLLQSNDEFITILHDTHTVESIEPNATLSLSDLFEISASPGIPDQHPVKFTLVATNGNENWNSEISLMANAPNFELAGFTLLEIGGNNNGKFDSGETVQFTVFTKNIGHSGINDIKGTLTTNDPYITVLTKEPQYFGNCNPGEIIHALFQVKADQHTPFGHQALFVINFVTETASFGSNEFSITIGPIPILVVDLDGNHNSAPSINDAADHLGIVSEYAIELPDSLNHFSSIFLSLGVYNANHILSPNEGQKLADYLNNGGRLYMEGGDTWYYDPVTAVHPLFGINGISDGTGNLDTIIGINGTFTKNLKMDFSGDNYWIDQLQATIGATVILKNNNPDFACGIARIGNGFKTIGTSFEFGGLTSEAQRTELLQKYLDFFDITIPASLSSVAYSISNNICEGDTTQMVINISGGSGNFDIQWSPTTGVSNPKSRETLAYPKTTTIYTVTVTDNLTGANTEHQIPIVVKEKPSTPEIIQIDQILISDATTGNQWYNNDGLIEGATKQTFTPTKTNHYWVVVTNTLGCKSEKSNVIYFQSTFIEEPVLQGTIRFYPNPSEGLVYIDFAAERTGKPLIQVYNAFGQPLTNHIIQKNALQNTILLDLRALSNGVYYIKIFDGEHLFTKKLILSK